MEMQKIINFFIIQKMNIQNFRQKNGTLLTVNQKVIIHMKIQ